MRLFGLYSHPHDTDPANGRHEPSFRMSTAQLGVLILFVSIGALFVASLAAFWITRLQSSVWLTRDMVPLPRGLWVSTAVLAATSWAFQDALNSIRKNRFERLQRGLRTGGALAIVFLLLQVLNWREMMAMHPEVANQSLYAFTFYLLTGLHWLHVVGGFAPLGVVLYRVNQREYSSSRMEGIKFCVQYWHYLGAIWLVLLTTLYVAI